MRAIIDATGYREEIASLFSFKPSPLLCIAGKPIIYHVIEFLVQQQITQFDIILSYLPQQIEDALEDGQRWGVEITYHLARDPLYPFQAIQPFIHHLGESPVLFALGDCLPMINPETIKADADVQSRLFMFPDGQWSGWGVLSAEALRKFSGKLHEEDLPKVLAGKYTSMAAEPFLRVHTARELHESNVRFLNSEHVLSFFPTTAHTTEARVWICHGVSLHPTVKIISPVFIGEFSQIHKNAVIGPNVVIEDFCVIGEESIIENALICKDSYVGEGLNISNSLIDRNNLTNFSFDAHITLNDGFILGQSHPKPLFGWILDFLERACGALFFLLLYPVYLWMFSNHILSRLQIVKLPTNEDPLIWKTVLWEVFKPLGEGESKKISKWCRLPLLKAIMRGDIHFVGARPQTVQELQKMPLDKKNLYLRSKVGMVCPSDIKNSFDATEHGEVSEALYVATHSPWMDWKIFFKWLITPVSLRSD